MRLAIHLSLPFLVVLASLAFAADDRKPVPNAEASPRPRSWSNRSSRTNTPGPTTPASGNSPKNCSKMPGARMTMRLPATCCFARQLEWRGKSATSTGRSPPPRS